MKNLLICLKLDAVHDEDTAQYVAELVIKILNNTAWEDESDTFRNAELVGAEEMKDSA